MNFKQMAYAYGLTVQQVVACYDRCKKCYLDFTIELGKITFTN